MLDAIAARIEGKAYTPADLAQLVGEVERLRGGAEQREKYISALESLTRRLQDAIHAHRRQSYKTYKVSQAWWDEDLWAVLGDNYKKKDGDDYAVQEC